MTIDRLTKKAQDLVHQAAKEKKLTTKKVLEQLSLVEGVGKFLLEAIPPKGVKKTDLVDLNLLVKEAFYQAIKLEHKYVGTEHLYLALLKLNSSKNLERARLELFKLSSFPNSVDQNDPTAKTLLLNSFGEDLNKKALKDYSFSLVYRDVYKKLVSTLLLKENYNALLVGDPGVGKRSLVELLVRHINSLDVPPSLVGYSLVTFNVMSFMTSVANKGGLDFGISSLIDELKSQNRVILVLEGFQDIFYSSPAGLTIPIFYSILKTQLDQAGVKLIAYLTPSVYDRIIAENEHLLNNFTLIEVDEPTNEEIREILKVNAVKLEDYHNVSVSKEVLEYVFKKAQDEFKNDKFPQKGIDLLDYACAFLVYRKSRIPGSYKDMVDSSFELATKLDQNLDIGKYDRALKVREKITGMEKVLSTKEHRIFEYTPKMILSVKDIDDALFHLGLAQNEIGESTNLVKIGKLAAKIKKEIIGQDDAVDVVVKALIRARLGLRAKKRPLGNFLFLGPTGVGKTELAKILAKKAFAKDNYTGIIRLDMSDFAEKHTVARLIGAPPGYIGYGEGGELTSKIEAHPNSVVLFDEIEKAHPDVLNILLQIMEEAELSDARGNLFDFSKSVVILTSNLGTDIIHTSGIGYEEGAVSDQNLEDRLKNNLKKILKPELLNRFDELVVFKRLTKANQTKILSLRLKEVISTLSAQNVNLKVSTSARKYLLSKGYSKEYGARELRRVIEKELLDKIAQVLISNESRPLSLVADSTGGGIKIS